MRCSRFDHRQRSPKQAFTLLEVIVGLTLMASVLTSSLLAFSAHRKQQRFAESKLQAVAIGDQLLDRLSGSPQGIPPSARGLIAGKSNWFWTTRIVGTMTPAGIPMRVIRFEIIEQRSPGVAQTLVTVDVVASGVAG